MAGSQRDDSLSWAYRAEQEPNTVASTATLVKRPSGIAEAATDALTGMIISSPIKKQRVSADGAVAVAGYSPELTRALKSVVKIFTTMAR